MSPLIDEEELRVTVAQADRRTLAAAVIHLSGDPNAILDARDRTEVEHLALELLPHYLEGNRTVPELTDEVLLAAMSAAAGAPVPARYVPMVREQMAFGPVEEQEPLSAPPNFNVVIIGAGLTGIVAGLFLKRLGFNNFVILDRNSAPGGTWWQNTYPGCRVDTPSIMYSWSWDPDPGWPNHFSFQPDLLAYVNRTIEAGHLRNHFRCGVEVEALHWDEEERKWRLDLCPKDRKPERIDANVVIGAVGILNIPRYPDIEGASDFAGPSFHSAEWDHGVDLTGKRVAVIGTGASANQIVPAIAPKVAELYAFQRAPHWIMPHPYYDKALVGTERWLMDNIPTYRAWFRFRQFWSYGDSLFENIRIDPAWPHQDRSVNRFNERLRQQCVTYIEEQLATKPELIEKVTPQYPPFVKRLIVDNGWYRALTRDNVHLETAPIRRIVNTGIETDGGHIEVDVIIYATGFYSNRTLWPIRITGADGVDVRAGLDKTPKAYRGVTLEACPNLLLAVGGPLSLPGHGGSYTLVAEMGVNYVVQLLRAMFDNGWTRVEVRPEAVHEWTQGMADEVERLVYSYRGVTSWLRGEYDTVTLISPRLLIDMWEDSKRPDISAFQFS